MLSSPQRRLLVEFEQRQLSKQEKVQTLSDYIDKLKKTPGKFESILNTIQKHYGYDLARDFLGKANRIGVLDLSTYKFEMNKLDNQKARKFRINAEKRLQSS